MKQPRYFPRDKALGHRVWSVAVATTLCAAASMLLAVPADAITEPFNYTGGEQQFVVPTGVHTIKVLAIGGTGGPATPASGGEAAELSGGLTVTPGETLYVEVGGVGKSQAEGGGGGFNGGASGAGGGGGASDIRTSPRSSGLSPGARLLIAAGGGGAGGADRNAAGGKGGAAGEAGETSSGGNHGGNPGTPSEGGAGGRGCIGGGEMGHFGLGGAGGAPGGNEGEGRNSGGGGGGGLYGGGGGGGGCVLGGGGGGGGSSLASGGILSLTTAPPKIEITYSPPPSVTITRPADEALYPQGKAIEADYSCQAGEGTTLKSCTGPVVTGAPFDTSTSGEFSFTVNAEDNDSGQASKTVSYTVVPTPSIEIGSPASGATYTKGQTVTAAYSCLAAEGLELESCSGPVASGAAIDTATPGPHNFTVTAGDDLGGESIKTVSYTVYPPPAVEIGSPASGATYTQGQTVTAAYACLAAEGLELESCAGPVASGAAFDTATPGPHNFTVEAEDSIGGLTSRSVGYTVAAPLGSTPPGPAPASAPETTLGSHPKTAIKTKRKKALVKFSFSSDVAGATFECKLDKAAFAPCTSPNSYSVKRGSHTFSVEAVGPGGTDTSPAMFSFKVKKKNRPPPTIS